MAKKIKISAEEQTYIDNNESKLKELIDGLERAKQFKVGDYLIMFSMNYSNTWELQTNSYGAPTKYMVVHVTPSGFPFMKEINAHGTPVGTMMPGIGKHDYDDYIGDGYAIRWELDPDYADSLLLQQDYDPAQLHKNKKQVWKEVTEHNKKSKIKTDEIQPIVEFFRTLNIGDTIWTSNVSHHMVREIKTLARKEAMSIISHGWSTRVRGPHVLVLNIVDKKGVVKDIAADFFFCKALYRERPRTYKELNL